MADVIITPASGLIDFQNVSGISSATIQLDGDGNLALSAAGGDIQIGDTSSDIFIGDGINNVDLIFEEDGEIRGLTGKTITLGQSDSFISFAGDITGNISVTGTVDGRDIASDGSKLDGIESGATADQTASEILTAIKTVDGTGSGLDADLLDGIQGASFLRSDTADTATGEILFASARTDFGSSGNWNAVGFSNVTNLHPRDYDNFWFGAGNGTWFTGTANSQSQASGLAADVGTAHDLLLSTMQSDVNYDRGITFAVDSTGAGNSGWRLGKWHSGDARDSSKFVVDGQIFGKAGNTDEYDYYGDDYSVNFSNQGGQSHWGGDSGYGWNTPGVVSSSAIQIQSGNAGTNTRKPQIQFHQYGYGGPAIEYDGPNDTLNIIGPTSRLSNTGFKQQGNTIWHAGNDGAGSGLDADLLDGISSASFLRSDANDTATGALTIGNAVYSNYTSADTDITGLVAGSTFGSLIESSLNAHLVVGLRDNDVNDSFSVVSGSGNYATDSTYDKLVFQAKANGTLTANGGNTIWHAANDGAGSGLDADTIDGTQLSNLMTLSGTQTITGDKDFDGTLTYDLITGPNTNTRDKIRVWSGNPYSIGMKNGFSYGGLGGSGTNYAMSFQMSDTTDRGWWWGDSTHTDAQGAASLTTLGKMTLAHSLRIGYGESDTTIPGATHRLDVSGSILATGDITAFSDINLKENIEVIPNALDKVSQIRGVTFIRKDLDDKSRKSGVIAQEVEKVLPEVVTTTEDGTKTVAYGNLVGLLIESIKELKAEVEELKKERN